MEVDLKDILEDHTPQIPREALKVRTTRHTRVLTPQNTHTGAKKAQEDGCYDEATFRHEQRSICPPVLRQQRQVCVYTHSTSQNITACSVPPLPQCDELYSDADRYREWLQTA